MRALGPILLLLLVTGTLAAEGWDQVSDAAAASPQPPSSVDALPQESLTNAPPAFSAFASWSSALKGTFHLTLTEAENYALKNHPQILSAQITAQAVRQQVHEASAAFFPQLYGESASVYAPDNTRIAAPGGLNNPTIYSRQSDGIVLSQLITDFGYTFDLTESAHFRAVAAADRAKLARALVVLAVDHAYFDLLKAEAMARVAQNAVDSRHLVYDQILLLMKNKLKSGLDSSLAESSFSQAKLLLLQAENGISQAEAELSAALGFPGPESFTLTDEPLDLQAPAEADTLITQALFHRPEVAALQGDRDAAQRFADAQQAAEYPKISAQAAAGVNPIAPSAQLDHTYYTAGLTVSVPLFDGGEIEARRKEARLLADAATENVIQAQNAIARDVKIAWLQVKTARERIDVTNDYALSAAQGQKLAQARYDLGLSSIVELTQAELNSTEAQMEATSARYDYQNGQAMLSFAIGQPSRQP